ncbi:hypothetical protein DFH29DRAFT_807903 [Suillus ampliporus]|nr:hypothetical protein DFH29DRAFT_807903 [Suillus ampliporus]
MGYNASQLTAGKTPDDIQLDVTKPILHDRSVQWFVEASKLINKPDIVVKAFSLCTAGADNTFNLSFDSLTSVEARRMLRDLLQTAPDMWERIQSRRQPVSKDPTVPALVPEDTIEDDDDDEPGDEAPLELLLQFVASGKKCAPDGYRIDVDGSLVVDSAADMFEEVLMSEEPVQLGRGKRRHVVNKQYDGFEQH